MLPDPASGKRKRASDARTRATRRRLNQCQNQRSSLEVRAATDPNLSGDDLSNDEGRGGGGGYDVDYNDDNNDDDNNDDNDDNNNDDQQEWMDDGNNGEYDLVDN